MDFLGISLFAWLIWIGVTLALVAWAHQHGLDRGALAALAKKNPTIGAEVGTALDHYVSSMHDAAGKLESIASSAARNWNSAASANAAEPAPTIYRLADTYWDTDDLLIAYGKSGIIQPLWIDKKLRKAGAGNALNYYTIPGTDGPTVTITPQAPDAPAAPGWKSK